MNRFFIIIAIASLSSCSLFLTPKKNISRLIEKHEYLPKKDTVLLDTILIDTLKVERIDTLNKVDSIVFYSDSISYKIYREFDTIKTFIQCTTDTVFLEKKIKITDSDKVISKIKKDNRISFSNKVWIFIWFLLIFFLIFVLLPKRK